MNTAVIVYNLRRFIFISLSMSLLFLLTACPGEEDCFDLGSTTRVNDLILLTPKQTEYSQGDEVTLSLSIPATNSYFGNEINLFQETGDDSALLILGFNQLFLDNHLSFINGDEGNSESNNWYIAYYNQDSQKYELEIEISLDRVGQYSFYSDSFIDFDGGGCNKFSINTNVLWEGVDLIEFTVVE